MVCRVNLQTALEERPAPVSRPTVLDILRRFIPHFRALKRPISDAQWRAIRAIQQCRTSILGGNLLDCPDCEEKHFAYYSCNHKACPQCGRAATQKWVARQLKKLTGAPYFMVTFTLPEELRVLFFGDLAKEAYDIFFASVSRSLAEKLGMRKYLGAKVSGFTAVLHTWNQQLLFHPHIHCIVPGVGIDADGKVRCVKSANYLVHQPTLCAAFREAFREELAKRKWGVDPSVWRKEWGVHIQESGSGASAIKYLGAYVKRTAIGDSRIVKADEHEVTFLWKDRDDGNVLKPMTLTGVEFVQRYLRHVLPPKMHSLRYYGFCHPAAKKKLERVQFFTGMPLRIGPEPEKEEAAKPEWLCPHCKVPMRRIATLPRKYHKGISSHLHPP